MIYMAILPKFRNMLPVSRSHQHATCLIKILGCMFFVDYFLRVVPWDSSPWKTTMWVRVFLGDFSHSHRSESPNLGSHRKPDEAFGVLQSAVLADTWCTWWGTLVFGKSDLSEYKWPWWYKMRKTARLGHDGLLLLLLVILAFKVIHFLKLTAKASENRPGPKSKRVFQASFFSCYVSFREGKW